MNKLETREDGLYINEKKVIKGWESMSGWYWFATEIEMEDYQGYPIWFGFVQGFEEEWGSFTQIELENQPSIWEIKEIDLPHAGRRNK